MRRSEKSNGRPATSLFARITKSVIFLVVGLFLVTGIAIGVITYNSSQNLMLGELNEVSLAYTLVVEKELGILREQLNSIADFAAGLPGPLSSSVTNAKLDAMKSDKGFTTIYGIDKSGETSTPGILVNDRDYFIAAMQGNFFASSPFLKSDNTVGITVAVPAYRNDAIVGIVSVGLNYDYFSAFVDYRVGKTGTSYIIDKAGTVVACQDPSLVMNFYNAVEQAKTDAARKDQAALLTQFLGGSYEAGTYRDPDGKMITAVAQPITGTDGWVLVTTMDSAEINQTAVLVLGVLAVIVAVGVAISIAAAMALARGISHPITGINTRLTQLSLGDLSTPVALVNTGDEIQTLSHSLSDTVMQLRMYILEISRVTQSMAAYNLHTELTGAFLGEFAPIKDSLNQILSLMNHAFGEISQAAEQVNAGAEQVSQAAQSLSSGTQQQAGSIEELSATISTVSEKVMQNAQSAQGANGKVEEVRSKIEESNDQMQQLIGAMSEISVSSGEIGKIIKTIEDIAFQTNILALNAAVEAARAGNAGKGFAVVADEVRNLANKSQEAAKNTTALIEDSIHAVENGAALADNAAQHLQAVVAGAVDVSDMVAQISDASKEQALSISQITIGIDQISSVVQSNSATAEESAAASEELSSQATMLQALTDRFTLNREA